MKKLIVAGSLAAGLAALAAWRIRQSKMKTEDFAPAPDEVPMPAVKDEPVGV